MRMYDELAPWFHLVTHPRDYASEAAQIAGLADGVLGRAGKTLLELGSGGGNNASHLKDRYTCTLTDVSEPMLELSRSINPECEHLVGDMRTLRLAREFDIVLVHDAIDYITTVVDLKATIETAAAHLIQAASRFSFQTISLKPSRPARRRAARTMPMAIPFDTWNGHTISKAPRRSELSITSS